MLKNQRNGGSADVNVESDATTGGGNGKRCCTTAEKFNESQRCQIFTTTCNSVV